MGDGVTIEEILAPESDEGPAFFAADGRYVEPGTTPAKRCTCSWAGDVEVRDRHGDTCPQDRGAITPAEQRTGVSDVQASIADEVAGLRAEIVTLTETEYAKATYASALARLDRIAALVPQRATDRFGQALWVHDGCGCVRSWSAETLPKGGLWCADEDGQTADWRALYTVAGR